MRDAPIHPDHAQNPIVALSYRLTPRIVGAALALGAAGAWVLMEVR